MGKRKHEVMFSDELWKQVGIAAAKEGVSRAEWIRRACRVALVHGLEEKASSTAVILME